MSRPQRPTVAQIWDAYLEDRGEDGKDTKRQAEAWVALKDRFGSLRPEHVTKAQVRAYVARRPASINTVRTELIYLRAALKWAERTHWIDAAPHVKVPPRLRREKRRLTRAEAARLVAAAKAPHVRLFVLVALHTAARTGAILDLTWDRVEIDCEPEFRRIDFRNPERPETNKRRTVVPVNETLYAALAEARKAAVTDHVIEWTGRPITSIKHGFSEAVRAAGLAGTGVGRHTLRHTAAVWMAERGVPMELISQYLGHDDVRMTEREYARYSPTYLMQAAKALEG